jgi:hypothetical protein
MELNLIGFELLKEKNYQYLCLCNPRLRIITTAHVHPLDSQEIHNCTGQGRHNHCCHGNMPPTSLSQQ